MLFAMARVRGAGADAAVSYPYPGVIPRAPPAESARGAGTGLPPGGSPFVCYADRKGDKQDPNGGTRFDCYGMVQVEAGPASVLPTTRKDAATACAPFGPSSMAMLSVPWRLPSARNGAPRRLLAAQFL